MTGLSGVFKAATIAYLDPGTGTMIISAIVGIFATIALALKTYWYKFVGLFRGKSESTSCSGKAGEADKTCGCGKGPGKV